MKDPFIREKFTRAHSFARQFAREYFEKYPKDRYQTEIESWRKLQSDNIEYTMRRVCTENPIRVDRMIESAKGSSIN